MQQAIRLQEMLATTTEETARAARRASDAAGGQSRELLQAAQAAEALAAKERAAAVAAQVHADVIDKVQMELNREASSVETVIGAQRRLGAANDNAAKSTGAHRAAMVNLGAQMQDAVVQLQSGAAATTVLIQQGSQAAYALSGMGGVVGSVARVLAGPWGAAVLAGTAVLGPLIAGLFETSDAMDDVKFSSSAMGTAQGILGNVLDLTTGRITTQSSALMGLARAQLAVARVQSVQKAADARGQIKDLSTPAWYEYFSFTDRRSPEQFRKDRASMLDVGDVLGGNTDKAIQHLEGLLKAGKIKQDQFAQLAAAYANLGIEDANAKVYDQAEALLNGTGGRGLLKPTTVKTRTPRSGTDKAAAEAERLAKAGASAAEQIARIDDRFDAAPKLIDSAAAATRELDKIITDLSEKDPVKFKDTIAQAEAAKKAVQEALVRPIDDARQASERRLQVQSLLALGHEDEAAALQAVWALEEKLGSEEDLRAKVQALIAAGRTDEAAAVEKLLAMYPSMKRQTAEVAEIEARRSREIERQKVLFDAQLDVLNQAKQSLTGLLSGRKVNLFGDIKQALADLQGKRLFDTLFGDVFRDLEDQMRGQSPLGRESQRAADAMSVATIATQDLAKAFGEGAAAIRAAAKGASNDNSNGYIDGTGNIYVTRNRPTAPADGSLDVSALVNNSLSPMNFGLAKKPIDIGSRSIVELATKLSGAFLAPFQEVLNQVFGTKLGQTIGGAMSGVMAGKLTGGTTGGILGGLKGLVDNTKIFGGKDGALSEKLGGAMNGAATGSIVSGIGKSLGINMSQTGAQIGGAIGSFIPIPGGDIIGAIAGGILGGLFKKKPYGTASLTSATEDATITGNKGSARDAAGTLAGSVQQGLVNIADQLGAQLGNFAVSIGTYKDNYRVSTQGGSAKLGGHSGSAAQNEAKYGLYDFGSDSEAAIKFAISDAIKDGALLGLRKSTAALLQAGEDIDAQTQKAVTWENAFKELKSYTDPVGAALDTLDQQFKNLISISKEAGASQEELAQLEQLYGIKRTEIVKAQSEQIVGSLQSLYKDLTTGDNGLSLRDRRAAALTTYDSLATKVAAGDKTAYSDYADAAQSLLGIERDLYGSQQQYFDRLNEITDLTKTRIDAETNVVSIAANRDSPFDSTGAVTSSIDTQTQTLSSQLNAVNTNIGDTNAALARIEAAVASGRSITGLAFSSSY